MSTLIKRLKQNGTEFVPITMAEAVVVNTQNLAGFENTITTLDKILGQYGISLGELNTALANKQDVLTAGAGIEIVNGQDGKPVISCTLDTTLYKIIDATEFALLRANPSDAILNTIYLVPAETKDEVNANVFAEFICYKKETGDTVTYSWEKFGEVSATVDLTKYLTKEEFTLIGVTAEDVTTSTGVVVAISYAIPTNLYDSAVATIETDKIEGSVTA